MNSREALGYLTARVWLGRHLTSPQLSSGLWNGCSCASSGWKLVRHGARNALCAGHRGVNRGVSYSGEKRGVLGCPFYCFYRIYNYYDIRYSAEYFCILVRFGDMNRTIIMQT